MKSRFPSSLKQRLGFKIVTVRCKDVNVVRFCYTKLRIRGSASPFGSCSRPRGVNLPYIAVIGATIFANAFAAIADFVCAGFVSKTADEVGVARSWLPVLGALKGAAVIGLLLGIVGVPVVGTAAAAGLVVFFIGALAAHVRRRVFYNIAFPGFFFVLAVASLMLSIRR